MIIPKKMRIRGSYWYINRVDMPIGEDGKPEAGTCDPKTKTIEIEKAIKGDRLLEIFLHEYFHAIAFEVGIDDEEPPSWIEHMLVIAGSKDMTNNKEVFKAIFS